MSCQICGDERSTYRNRSRMSLCASCHKDTPAKVDRETFDRLYWETADGPGPDSVPESIRREFYSDYRASTCASVKQYRDQTTSHAM